jgi:endogenous inhibitor of DNA gyrase (YacG/DUF329 family)
MNERQKRDIQALRGKGLTYADIAERVGLNINTVKSFCRRTPLVEQDKCRNCGKALCHSSKTRQKSFCSNHCRNSWWNNNRHELKPRDTKQLACAYCGAEFAVAGKRDRKYCCHECYIADRYGDNA